MEGNSSKEALGYKEMKLINFSIAESYYKPFFSHDGNFMFYGKDGFLCKNDLSPLK